MTGAPQVAPDVISSGPLRQAHVPGSRAVLREAVVTSAAHAAGFALALATLPPAPTPRGVAEAFVAARFDEDWAEAWASLCSRDQSSVGYEAFAERAARRHDLGVPPSEVEFVLGDTRLAREPADPQFTVPLTLTIREESGSRVVDTAIPLATEDGAVRVCFSAVDHGA
jgi:hypothetical protein